MDWAYYKEKDGDTEFVEKEKGEKIETLETTAVCDERTDRIQMRAGDNALESRDGYK